MLYIFDDCDLFIVTCICFVSQISTNLRSPGSMVPSVYEMAALTQDLDTHTITTRIKEILLANNIGQKVMICLKL